MPDAARTIQLLIAPVVMISAFGLLCLALYNRLAAIVSRARSFHKEQFDIEAKLEAGGAAADPVLAGHLRRRFASLAEQAERILGRARKVRNALLIYLAVILCMLACSLAIGLSLLSPAFGRLALALFLGGVCLGGAGTLLAMLELTRALDPVTLEYTAYEEHPGHP